MTFDIDDELIDENDKTWRCEVYGMDAVTIDRQCDVPKGYMKIAREIFAGTLVNMPSFKGAATGKKADEKIDYLGRVVHACKRALSSNAAVRYTRNKNSDEYADIYIQIIDCLGEATLIRDVKTPPGNAPCESRLLPHSVLLEQTKKCRLPNPWRTNPRRMKYYVEVRDENKNSVPFDMDHPTAKYSQRVLEMSNFVNSLCRVWYPVASGEWQQLITEQYRIFRPGFDRHGRIYTRGISHQNIRREERLLIEFERYRREPSIEYDYKNFFALMCYHLKGLEFKGEDLYKYKGSRTSDAERYMFKQVVNRSLNSATKKLVLDGFAEDMKLTKYDKKIKGRKPKVGRERAEALELQHYHKQIGDSLGDMYEIMLKLHAPIAEFFGAGTGLRLMKEESDITMKIMEGMATLQAPLLCVHDSHITTEPYGPMLKKLMIHFYQERFNSEPRLERAKPALSLAA